MATYKTARIIPIAIILIIAALAIAALFSIARALFFPNSITNNNVDISHTSLVSSTAGRSVKMTVRGPIVSEEDFRSYEITASPNQRTLVTYQGYVDKTLESVSLSNNIPAYEEFVHALDNASMMNGTELTGSRNDTRGVCASGYVYEFGIYNDGKLVKELWTSSCSSARGSLSTKYKQLKTLFISQIPTAKTVTEKLW